MVTEVSYKKPDTTYPLSRNEVLLKEGSGGGTTPPDDPANTATDEEVKEVVDNIWD